LSMRCPQGDGTRAVAPRHGRCDLVMGRASAVRKSSGGSHDFVEDRARTWRRNAGHDPDAGRRAHAIAAACSRHAGRSLSVPGGPEYSTPAPGIDNPTGAVPGTLGNTPSGVGSSGIGGTTSGSPSAPTTTPVPQGGTAPSATPGASTIQR